MGTINKREETYDQTGSLYATKQNVAECWQCNYDSKSPILRDLNKIEYGIRPHGYTVHMKQNNMKQFKNSSSAWTGCWQIIVHVANQIVLGNKEHSQAPSFVDCEWKCCIRVTTAELSSCDRDHDLQSIKYLLSCPSQEKFASPWSKNTPLAVFMIYLALVRKA